MKTEPIMKVALANARANFTTPIIIAAQSGKGTDMTNQWIKP